MSGTVTASQCNAAVMHRAPRVLNLTGEMYLPSLIEPLASSSKYYPKISSPPVPV